MKTPRFKVFKKFGHPARKLESLDTNKSCLTPKIACNLCPKSLCLPSLILHPGMLTLIIITADAGGSKNQILLLIEISKILNYSISQALLHKCGIRDKKKAVSCFGSWVLLPVTTTTCLKVSIN